MCQYDARCRVGRHRPGTSCPYAGTGYAGPPRWASTAPARPVRAPVSPAVRRDRSVTGSGACVSLAALIVALVIGADGRDDVSVGLVVTAACLVIVPLAVGAWLTERCTGWRVAGELRCAQPRRGVLQRCVDHRRQYLTLYDAASTFAYVVATVNLFVLGSTVL